MEATWVCGDLRPSALLLSWKSLADVPPLWPEASHDQFGGERRLRDRGASACASAFALCPMVFLPECCIM